jgi:Mn2+/Fe2+ NRAMP family transporter
MTEQPSNVESERQAILEAKQEGRLATTKVYLRLSGPGWLQSALTLGGGSLASSLFLGALAGFGLLWLQPVAMIFGIIMLSAIGYVAMSTTERPFQAINRHINPVLGWGWALATLTANMVWALPQYSLASGVLQQNLLPKTLGPESSLGQVVGNAVFSVLPALQGPDTNVADFGAKVIVSASILLITTLVTLTYDSGGWGIKVYELMLKLVVAGIVLCFAGVVTVVAVRGQLDWGAVLAGFIPDLNKIFQPAEGFNWLLAAVPAEYAEMWSGLIVRDQRDVMISAAATAVGINMTFLLPYSMIRRGWDKDFRGLAIFDLSTGMFIPFVLATSCVIIASATQFHPNRAAESAMIVSDSQQPLPEISETKAKALMTERLKIKLGAGQVASLSEQDLDRELAGLGELTRAEILLASHLERKDAFDLAQSLAPLTGDTVANVIFGVGVLGMTLSSITLLMLISGFVICEMLGLPPTGWPNRIGTLAAATGVLGPFLWSGEARFWLAVPTSVFCFTLLPFAYLTFLFVMNSKSLLGDQMPRGIRRVGWNTAMGSAASVATAAAVYMVFVKTRDAFLQLYDWPHGGYVGLGMVGAVVLLVVFVHFVFPRNAKQDS